MTPALCPHCGHDLEADAPIERGDIRSDPRGSVTWKGQELDLSQAHRILIHTLLKAEGRVVPVYVLAERMGSESENPSALISVQRHHIRRRIGFRLPIETVLGVGLRWAA